MDESSTANFLASEDRFKNTWAKYDVLETGWIEIERMALFYKELLGDWKVAIQ